MQQTTFSRINTCVAWLVFAMAAIVYGLTIEPTASLWDCPEFIACGYKLEIGHPPGAPFYMLAANLFSHLACDTAHVAMMVNLLSALLSAGCIFFLFLTITHLAKRLIGPPAMNIQGHGEVEHGNWITGIHWIDDWLLGCDTSKLPSDLAENKGHNVFFALPLLLGLAGIGWQWRNGDRKSPQTGRQQLWVVMLLFVMTGLAIVVYLNQTPLQPRERDYAYAGSFYAFAIWIGLGVGMVTRWCQKLVGNKRLTSAIAGAVCCLAVPLQMVSQTWDDHDRSGRYTCRDFGANYLESMQREGHPIILTDGDNDTFPLWYNHEVEGVRTDTRDCNMEYLQTDWYIDQMKRPAYDSLLQQGDTKRALTVCRKWQQEMPKENVPYTDAALSMARCYYQSKQPEAGDAITGSLLRRSGEWLSWIETITPTRRGGSLYSEYSWMRTMQQALSLAVEYGRNEIHHQYSKQYEHHFNH